MKQGVFILIGVFLLIGLPGCVKIQDKQNSQQDAQVEAANQPYQILSTEQYDDYSVQLFPNAQTQIILRKNSHKQDGAIEVIQGSDINHIIDQRVKAGEDYEYTFAQMGAGGTYVPLKSFVVHIPKDLMISDFDKDLEGIKNKKKKFEKDEKVLIDEASIQILDFKRVYFKNHLLTMGKNLTVRAEQVYFDESIIETFPEGLRANEGVDGRSGGLISLSSQKMAGKVQFILRGEDGGAGAKGDPTPGRGPKGDSGRTIHFSSSLGSYQCMVEKPEPGHKGFQGAQGRPGNDGMSGGSAGSLEMSLVDKSELIFQVAKYPGVGGDGGLGGLGQAGGPGGDPSPVVGVDRSYFEQWPGSSCNAAAGGDGDPGVQGPSGQHGHKGDLGSVCITQNNIRNCDQK